MVIEYIVFFGLLVAGLLAFSLYPKQKRSARDTRKCSYSERDRCKSYIERRLFDALTARGYVVSTQVYCGNYRIDLALKGPQIAIECDGKAYHSTPEQKAHDRKKNRFLKKQGWNVMRFSGRQINRNLGRVLQRIEETVRERF